MMRRMGIIAAVVMVIGVTGGAARAGELRGFSSRFYRIETDVDMPTVRRLAKHMDAVYAEYMQRFSGFGVRRGAGPQPLFVFQQREDYLRYLSSKGVNAEGTGGIFFVQPAGSGLATFVSGQPMDQLLHTLQHEGFHQFAYARIGPKLPPWANEGIAEYFGESVLVGNHMITGQVPGMRLDRIRAAEAAGKLQRFDELMNMTGEQWINVVNRGEGGLLYDQSWAMVHFLVDGGPQYRAAFVRYLELLSRGIDSRRAFDASFHSSYRDFEAAWKRYLKTLKADPQSTAAQRLEFLGLGLGMLSKHGEKVESLDQLKSRLQSIGFRVTRRAGHGPPQEFSAGDPEMFQPPKPAANSRRPVTMELEPAKQGDLPPGLLVKGLKYPVRLVWHKDARGEPVSEVVYE